MRPYSTGKKKYRELSVASRVSHFKIFIFWKWKKRASSKVPLLLERTLMSVLVGWLVGWLVGFASFTCISLCRVTFRRNIQWMENRISHGNTGFLKALHRKRSLFIQCLGRTAIVQSVQTLKCNWRRRHIVMLIEVFVPSGDSAQIGTDWSLLLPSRLLHQEPERMWNLEC